MSTFRRRTVEPRDIHLIRAAQKKVLDLGHDLNRADTGFRITKDGLIEVYQGNQVADTIPLSDGALFEAIQH